MLELFFNRKGRFLNGVLLVACVLNVLQVLKLPVQWSERGFLVSVSYLFFIILAFSITIIRFFPWYTKESRGSGIEEHFEKVLVPVAYILLIGFVMMFFFKSPWLYFVLMDIFFIAVLSVNATLIYYHFIDMDPTPPSFFTTYKRNY